ITNWVTVAVPDSYYKVSTRNARFHHAIDEETDMWIPKALRDLKKGVDSPMPTQAVSNEEFIPRPQTQTQKHVEQLIGELSEVRARKLGISRRNFMRTSMGMATCFLASNLAFGKNYWDVDDVETWEPAAYDEKWPKSEYFIVDVQSHFTNGLALNFRNN